MRRPLANPYAVVEAVDHTGRFSLFLLPSTLLCGAVFSGLPGVAVNRPSCCARSGADKVAAYLPNRAPTLPAGKGWKTAAGILLGVLANAVAALGRRREG